MIRNQKSQIKGIINQEKGEICNNKRIIKVIGMAVRMLTCDAGYWMWSVRCGMVTVRCEMWDAGCGM